MVDLILVAAITSNTTMAPPLPITDLTLKSSYTPPPATAAPPPSPPTTAAPTPPPKESWSEKMWRRYKENSK